MSYPVGFNENDFFYNNVNAPIKFDPNLCNLSEVDLRNKISKELNIPRDITTGTIAKMQQDQQKGQCTFRKATAGDINTAQSWSLNYKIDSYGQQSCSCSKNEGSNIGYITRDPNVIKGSKGSQLQGYPLLNDDRYICKDSVPLTLEIKDVQINDIKLDQDKQNKILNSSVEYYKKVCENKNLAAELIKTYSFNEDGDIKQSDVQTFYNREYLNRINLGIGIILSCGLIYYTISSGSTINLIPTPPSNA